MKNEKLIVKKEEDEYKAFEGITLISLVITIILLIILAGIAINLSIGENGIFNKAKYAKEKYINAQNLEEEQLSELYNEVDDLIYDGIVRTVKSNVKISRGENKSISDYFIIKQTDEIESIKYVNETNENKEIENTKELVAGQYIINCIVTKKDKTEENAKITLIVDKILYVAATTSIDDYLNEELTVIGKTEDATIITNNSYYLEMKNNITFENLNINVNAICMNANNIKVTFKNCKLNLSGYNASNKKAGIISNKVATGSSLYLEKCIFQTPNSKIFDSWTMENINAYIKNDCTPSDISQFTTYITNEGCKSWILNSN